MHKNEELLLNLDDGLEIPTCWFNLIKKQLKKRVNQVTQNSHNDEPPHRRRKEQKVVAKKKKQQQTETVVEESISSDDESVGHESESYWGSGVMSWLRWKWG